MKSEQINKINEKQPYEKPLLRTIELKAEDVLGISCHTGVSGSSAFTHTPCDTSGIIPCVV